MDPSGMDGNRVGASRDLNDDFVLRSRPRIKFRQLRAQTARLNPHRRIQSRVEIGGAAEDFRGDLYSFTEVPCSSTEWLARYSRRWQSDSDPRSMSLLTILPTSEKSGFRNAEETPVTAMKHTLTSLRINYNHKV